MKSSERLKVIQSRCADFGIDVVNNDGSFKSLESLLEELSIIWNKLTPDEQFKRTMRDINQIIR